MFSPDDGLAAASRWFDGDAGPGCDNLAVTKAELHELIDALPAGSLEGAGVFLRGIIEGPIDPDQTWFWTPAWQAGEREADRQLVDGQGVVHHGTEEFVAHLESSQADDAA